MQLSRALLFLEGLRVVHRDIKPHNILVNPQTHQVRIVPQPLGWLEYQVSTQYGRILPEVGGAAGEGRKRRSGWAE